MNKARIGTMNVIKGLRGWRRVWLMALGISLGLSLLVVTTVFPSRSDVDSAYLARAIEIERKFDFSLAGAELSQLKSRYAGMAENAAVEQIRGRLHRLYAESSAPRDGEAKLPTPVGPLMWFDNRPLVTGDAIANLHSALAQLDDSHRRKLASLPARKARALTGAMLLVLVPMGMLFAVGTLLEGPAAARSAAPAAADALPNAAAIPDSAVEVRRDAPAIPANAFRLDHFLATNSSHRQMEACHA